MAEVSSMMLLGPGVMLEEIQNNKKGQKCSMMFPYDPLIKLPCWLQTSSKPKIYSVGDRIAQAKRL
jgi:hypothetical protein